MGFFSSETPQQKMRKYKRSLDKTTRELDRERAKLGQQEKKIQIEMKKMAQKGETDAMRIMARDLVRTRKNSQKMYMMRTQIQGIALHIQTMSSTSQMTEAMKGVAVAMRSMNQQMNVPEMSKVMQSFEKESELMNMKDEMMNDAIDDAMDGEGDEDDEVETEVQKAMDEAQLNLQRQLRVSSGPVKQAPEVDEDDLVRRLNDIKRE